MGAARHPDSSNCCGTRSLTHPLSDGRTLIAASHDDEGWASGPIRCGPVHQGQLGVSLFLLTSPWPCRRSLHASVRARTQSAMQRRQNGTRPSPGLAAIVRRQRSDAPQPGESIEYFTLLSLKLEETGELRSSRDSSRNYDFTSRATFGIPRPAFRFSLFLFIFVLLFLFYRVKLAMYRWLLVHLQPHPVICSTTLSGRFGGGMKVVTDIGLNGALVWEMLVGVSRDKFPPSALRGTGGQADWSG